MSITGPTGGLYPPVHLPKNPTLPMTQPLYNFQQPAPIQQLTKPTVLSEVPVGKMAKIGAGIATGFGALRATGYTLFSETTRKSIKESPGAMLAAVAAGLSIAAAGGAINGGLLGWVFNKTQKKG